MDKCICIDCTCTGCHTECFGHCVGCGNPRTACNSYQTEGEKEIAAEKRDSLDEYAGNGGTDKLIGVDGRDEYVTADDCIEYDDVEYLGVFDVDDEED